MWQHRHDVSIRKLKATFVKHGKNASMAGGIDRKLLAFGWLDAVIGIFLVISDVRAGWPSHAAIRFGVFFSTSAIIQ